MVSRRHKKSSSVVVFLYLCLFFFSSCIGAQSAAATATRDDVMDLDNETTEPQTAEEGIAPAATEDDIKDETIAPNEKEEVVIEMTTVMDDGNLTAAFVDGSDASTAASSPISDDSILTEEQAEPLGETATTSTVEKNETVESATSATGVQKPDTTGVDLESLSNEQLEGICTDLGFLIQKDDGTDLTREDYLEAATRCKEMEAEIQSILDDNPELAVELDAEIERMKQEKERLEQEQASLLDKKSEIEEKLQAADVDLADVGAGPSSNEASSSASSTLSAATETDQQQPDSVDSVLRQSFEMLFDRVGRDLRLVGKVLRFAVLKPTGTGASLVWRTLGPTVERGVQHIMLFADGVAVPAFGKQVQTTVLPIVRRIAAPVVVHGSTALKATVTRLRTVDAIDQGFVIAGAFFGPLKNSLREGWTSIRPDVDAAREKFSFWLSWLRNEKAAAAAAS